MTYSKCELDDCDRPAYAHNLCTKHYQRWRKHGDVRHQRTGPQVCTVEDCDRLRLSNGLCSMHYQRWKRTGDPLVVRQVRGGTWSDRLNTYPVVITDAGCWEWSGSRDHQVYGAVRLNGRQRRAHRVSWEEAIGPIPPGRIMCHRCDNPPCINPMHLYPGTHADNAADRDRNVTDA